MDPTENPNAEKQACNDLYRIFGELEGKLAAYTCSWFGFFVTVHPWFFISRASMYFKSKGLKLHEWMESIKASRQGDILVLYGLCLLTDSHCVVHLYRNHIWSSLEYVPENHTILMARCEILLHYAANGIFIQLIPHEILIPASQDTGIKTEVLGILTAEESSTLLILMKEGLNKPKPKQVDNNSKPKPSATASAGSTGDLPCAELELQRPVTRSISKVTQPEKQKLLELRVKITPMSDQEIACFMSNTDTDILTINTSDTHSNSDSNIANWAESLKVSNLNKNMH